MTARAEKMTSAQLKALVSYDQSFLHCRTFGHSWKEVSTNRKTKDNVTGVVALLLRCTSCRTRRYDEVSMLSGSLLYRSYEYPENYLREEKTTRNEYRLALVKQALKKPKKV